MVEGMTDSVREGRGHVVRLRSSRVRSPQEKVWGLSQKFKLHHPGTARWGYLHEVRRQLPMCGACAGGRVWCVRQATAESEECRSLRAACVRVTRRCCCAPLFGRCTPLFVP
jgi:hypothetical protein